MSLSSLRWRSELSLGPPCPGWMVFPLKCWVKLMGERRKATWSTVWKENMKPACTSPSPNFRWSHWLLAPGKAGCGQSEDAPLQGRCRVWRPGLCMLQSGVLRRQLFQLRWGCIVHSKWKISLYVGREPVLWETPKSCQNLMWGGWGGKGGFPVSRWSSMHIYKPLRLGSFFLCSIQTGVRPS